MAITPSSMIPLGTLAPPFSLLDVTTQKIVSLDNLKSNIGTVIVFICNHCPFVKHIQKRLVVVAQDYQKKGIAFIAINSNDVKAYPEDSPANMQEEARKQNYPFPYLFDETQEVAKAYHATCTPDFFVFDYHLRCVYRGRFDGATPGNDLPVTGHELTEALDCLLTKRPISPDQKQSVGCNIKWK